MFNETVAQQFPSLANHKKWLKHLKTSKNNNKNCKKKKNKVIKIEKKIGHIAYP